MTPPEFLVQTETSLPPDWPAEQRADLVARETARGRELVASGQIAGIWRLPGRQANLGIWRVADADELHTLLSSLPAWPWMTVIVTALARHPLMPRPEDDLDDVQPAH